MPLTRRALLSTTAVTAALVATAAPSTALAATATATAARPASARPRTRGVRHIPLEGAVNVRDLGGYRTYDGDRVRHGRVYRADELGKLTDADVTTLAGLRLDRAIDFRVPFEVRQNGPDRLPAGVTPVSRPISDLGLYARLLQIIGSRDPVRQEEALGGDRGAELMRRIYRSFVTDATSRAQFAETLRDLVRARGPVLYHCTSGKDRTGWASYLVLRLVGVPDRTAREDFLLSNTYRAEADRRTREALRKLGLMQNPDLLIPVQEVRPDYLGAALSQAESDFGGLTGYVRDGLGLNWGMIFALRARLVD